jgi:hypothetical protein
MFEFAGVHDPALADQFFDIILGDEDWLDTEFEEIIADAWTGSDSPTVAGSPWPGRAAHAQAEPLRLREGSHPSGILSLPLLDRVRSPPVQA